MIVTIWRHGQAGPAATDRARQLTGTGTDDIGFGCRQLHELCVQRGLVHPQKILHSSWVRTTQTADIIDSAFTHASMESTPALIPGRMPADVDALLDALLRSDACPDHLVLVSHQPLVSSLADHYLGEHARVPALNPGGLLSLDMEVAGFGCGRLLFWALPPAYEAGA